MKTLKLPLDDELSAALDAVCAEQGRAKADLITDLLRKYVATERLKRALQDSSLIALYRELADEDVALAEEGMTDYQQMLEAADRP